MEEIKFITIDISNKTQEEIGKDVDESLAKENLIILENKECGYRGFLIPEKYITLDHLIQSIQIEPMIEPLKGYTSELQKELGKLKNFLSKVQ